MRRANNYAFIDSQNLNLAIRELGWELDLARFRVYLKEKYAVTRAYLFLGYIADNEPMYDSFRRKGYELIFKPVVSDGVGKVKGNCDGELILQAMIDFGVYDRAVIVSGDGDFHCLVKYLIFVDKLEKLLIPSKDRCSVLLKRLPPEHRAFVSDAVSLLAFQKRKAPPRDETRGSAFR